MTIAGMPNPVQVGNLLIGGQPSRVALAQLAETGYKTVLSVRGKSEVSWDEKMVADSLGMNFFSIEMENLVEEITSEQVERFAKLMEAGESPMVLHCGSGNRISGLWAVWLVEHRNVPPEEALRIASQTGMKEIRAAVQKRLGLGEN